MTMTSHTASKTNERVGRIRVGIGGWSYEPWRTTFYPSDLPKQRELYYASRQVTTIEINSTFYRLQSPRVFAKWYEKTPANFVFSIKAPRYIVQRRVLAGVREHVEKFLNSGLTELREKLGPILWQLPPQTTFVPEDLESFLQNLPRRLGELPLTHALEVRHESFRCPEFVDLARRHRVAVVYTHSRDYPAIADATGDFMYLRLREASSAEPTGYPPSELDAWLRRAYMWAQGETPEDVPGLLPAKEAKARDVFVYFINGAKERAPAAAVALLSLMGTPGAR